MDPRYLKFPLLVLNRICESFHTSTSSSSATSLKLHAKYFVLVLLNLKTLFCKICLKTFSFSLTPPCVLLFYTMSSANGKNHNTFH
uniref:Putative ovule protein n=1 Tax=Solanum chacoense TaxID=4108 RepID=A0A0V0GNK8_SOLCH